MKDHENERKSVEQEWEKKAMEELFGMEPEMSLQSARFATTENALLAEYGQERNEEEQLFLEKRMNPAFYWVSYEYVF